MNKDRKPLMITPPLPSVAPSPLPALPPRLARRCQSCGAPFETRCYSFEHCERCNVARMLAVSAYSQHESAWEERQRQADALARQAVAHANARRARRRRLLLNLVWGALWLAAGLLGLVWVGQ